MISLRIGEAVAVDGVRRKARVHFPDVDIVSGWLSVVQNTPAAFTTGATSGGSGEASFASHSHSAAPGAWLPSIGDTVLCIYGEGFNADGYILGGLS